MISHRGDRSPFSVTLPELVSNNTGTDGAFPVTFRAAAPTRAQVIPVLAPAPKASLRKSCAVDRGSPGERLQQSCSMPVSCLKKALLILAVSASAPRSREYFLYCFISAIVILSGSEESLSLERVLVVKGILRWRSE